jgi:hypothetical protein
MDVAEEERMTEQIEALEPGLRVDNLGMTGWGLDLMIRAIEHYCRKAAPDVVVLAFYTDDFRRLLPYYSGMGYEYPKFALSGSELVTVAFPQQMLWERLRIVQLVHQRIWARSQNRNRYDLNGALLDRYLGDAATIGFEPVVTFLPGRGDTEEDQERRSFLRKWTQQNNVPYLDLTAAIHGAGVDRVYIQGNHHWNATGHRIAAEQLRPVLLQVLQTATRAKNENKSR